jgi:hypothetical protein
MDISIQKKSDLSCVNIEKTKSEPLIQAGTADQRLMSASDVANYSAVIRERLIVSALEIALTSINLFRKLDVYLVDGRGALHQKYYYDYAGSGGRKYASASLREIIMRVKSADERRADLSFIILCHLDIVLAITKTI